MEQILKGIYELIKPNVGLIVALIIVLLNNSHNRKIKKIELENDLTKEREKHKNELKSTSIKETNDYEKIVHSSLIKILFEVQKLHISLSGKCDDYTCINSATSDFINMFTKYQTIIAESQIFLSSFCTNKIYKFYNILSDLLIELKNIQYKEKYEFAIVSVNEHSKELAQVIIEIQEHFVNKREELKKEFDKIELTDFSSCCGLQPPKELKEQYYNMRKELQRDFYPVEIKIDSRQDNNL